MLDQKGKHCYGPGEEERAKPGYVQRPTYWAGAEEVILKKRPGAPKAVVVSTGRQALALTMTRSRMVDHNRSIDKSFARPSNPLRPQEPG